MLNALAAQRASVVRLAEDRRGWTRSALATRIPVLVAGAAMILVPWHFAPALVALGVIGVAIATLSPARGGASVAVVAGIAGWFAAFGVHGAPPVARVLGFAAAIYLLHTSTALAAAVPLTTTLPRSAALAWARRCATHLGISAALIAVSYLFVGWHPRTGATGFQVAGLVAAAVVFGIVGWLFSRSLRR